MRIVFELLGAGEKDLALRLLDSLKAAAQKATNLDDEDAPLLRTIVDWLEGAEAADVAKTLEATGNVRWAALVALQAAIAASTRGDAKDGLAWAERAGEISRRLGMRSCEVRSRAWLAWHLAAAGHFDAAITTVRSAVRDAPGDRVAERDARTVMEFVESKAKEGGSWQKSS